MTTGLRCWPDAYDPTMTDEMMTLKSLLEKSADADLLREMTGFTAQRLLALEVIPSSNWACSRPPPMCRGGGYSFG